MVVYTIEFRELVVDLREIGGLVPNLAVSAKNLRTKSTQVLLRACPIISSTEAKLLTILTSPLNIQGRSAQRGCNNRDMAGLSRLLNNKVAYPDKACNNQGSRSNLVADGWAITFHPSCLHAEGNSRNI